MQILNRLLSPLRGRYPDISFETFARTAERITRLDDWGDDAAIVEPF